MARIRNEEEYKFKKQEIIKSAIGLIMESGYNSFSLNKLLETIEMPKGTLFHYFKSKQLLIDEAILYSGRKITNMLDEIAENTTFSPKEKIVEMFKASSARKYDFGISGETLAQNIYSKDNKDFVDLVTHSTIVSYRQFLAQVIKEGVVDKSFEIISFDGTLEQIVNITLGTNRIISEYILSDKSDSKKEKVIHVILTYERLINFMLGTTDIKDLYVIQFG